MPDASAQLVGPRHFRLPSSLQRAPRLVSGASLRTPNQVRLGEDLHRHDFRVSGPTRPDDAISAGSPEPALRPWTSDRRTHSRCSAGWSGSPQPWGLPAIPGAMPVLVGSMRRGAWDAVRPMAMARSPAPAMYSRKMRCTTTDFVQVIGWRDCAKAGRSSSGAVSGVGPCSLSDHGVVDGWVDRAARCPHCAGPFLHGLPPNRTCQLSRHPALQ